jgi:type VI secretion system secreted protein Hcp
MPPNKTTVGSQVVSCLGRVGPGSDGARGQDRNVPGTEVSMRRSGHLGMRHLLGAVAILAGLTWSTPASAATEECFLRIDGVAGDSVDARHRGEIDLVTWSLGVTTPVAPGSATGGASVGRPDFQPLKAVHRLDRAVPALIQLGAAAQHIPGAILTCRRPGKDAADYFKITLQDVLITGVRLSDSAEAQPSAELTLVYGRITIEYRPQNPDGTLGQPVGTGWDVRANRRL